MQYCTYSSGVILNLCCRQQSLLNPRMIIIIFKFQSNPPRDNIHVKFHIFGVILGYFEPLENAKVQRKVENEGCGLVGLLLQLATRPNYKQRVLSCQNFKLVFMRSVS